MINAANFMCSVVLIRFSVGVILLLFLNRFWLNLELDFYAIDFGMNFFLVHINAAYLMRYMKYK